MIPLSRVSPNLILMKRPFLLLKRGKYYYYRLAGEKTFHTTGKCSKTKAEKWVLDQIADDKDDISESSLWNLKLGDLDGRQSNGSYGAHLDPCTSDLPVFHVLQYLKPNGGGYLRLARDFLLYL